MLLGYICLYFPALFKDRIKDGNKSDPFLVKGLSFLLTPYYIKQLRTRKITLSEVSRFLRRSCENTTQRQWGKYDPNNKKLPKRFTGVNCYSLLVYFLFIYLFFFSVVLKESSFLRSLWPMHYPCRKTSEGHLKVKKESVPCIPYITTPAYLGLVIRRTRNWEFFFSFVFNS